MPHLHRHDLEEDRWG